MNTNPATFSVATYNIHRCIGKDGKQEASRIAGVIRELEAAIVGLQEVESFFHEDPGRHQLNYLAAATHLHATAGATVLRPDSHYGSALLTPALPLAIRSHDLSVPGREPRGALDVDVEISGRYWRIIVTHFGLGIRERKFQAGRLIEILAAQSQMPTILLGDFNEWFNWSGPLRRLQKHCGRIASRPTFPARFPCLALDRIWVLPAASLVHTRVHDSALAKIASDHLPLKAVVDFTKINTPLCEPSLQDEVR